MTTANQLRDALTAEAGGLPDATPAWDDIARRGRHRQRARRVQAVAAIAVLAGVAATTLALASDDQPVETGPANDPPASVPDDGIDPSLVLPGHMEFGQPPEGQGVGRPPGGGLNYPAGEGLGGATMDLSVTGLDGNLTGEARIENFSYISNGGETVVLDFECFETDATDLILGAIVTESTGSNPRVGVRLALLIRNGRSATVWWDGGLGSCQALLDAVPHPRPDDRFVEIIAEPDAG